MSATFFEVLREHLLQEKRRVFSAWYAQQVWTDATHALPAEQRRWHKAPNTDATGRTLARFQAEGKIMSIEGYPSVYLLKDASLPTAAPTAHELLRALHPNAVLTYESAIRIHQLTLRFTHQIHCSWDPENIYCASETDSRYNRLPPRQRPKLLCGQPIQWHRESAERLQFSERLDVDGVWMRVATMERTLVDGLANPRWCGGPAEVFRAWQQAFDFIDPLQIEQYATLLGSKVLYQRLGFVLETLGYQSETLDAWAENAQPGGSAILIPGRSWTPDRDERWKLGINFQHGLSA